MRLESCSLLAWTHVNIMVLLTCLDKQPCMLHNAVSDSSKHQQLSAVQEQQQQQQQHGARSKEQPFTLAIIGTTGTISANAAIAATSASFKWLGLRKKRHASTR